VEEKLLKEAATKESATGRREGMQPVGDTERTEARI
jgi:hypothetical protein